MIIVRKSWKILKLLDFPQDSFITYHRGPQQVIVLRVSLNQCQKYNILFLIQYESLRKLTGYNKNSNICIKLYRKKSKKVNHLLLEIRLQ